MKYTVGDTMQSGPSFGEFAWGSRLRSDFPYYRDTRGRDALVAGPNGGGGTSDPAAPTVPHDVTLLHSFAHAYLQRIQF